LDFGIDFFLMISKIVLNVEGFCLESLVLAFWEVGFDPVVHLQTNFNKQRNT